MLSTTNVTTNEEEDKFVLAITTDTMTNKTLFSKKKKAYDWGRQTDGKMLPQHVLKSHSLNQTAFYDF